MCVAAIDSNRNACSACHIRHSGVNIVHSHLLVWVAHVYVGISNGLAWSFGEVNDEWKIDWNLKMLLIDRLHEHQITAHSRARPHRTIQCGVSVKQNPFRWPITTSIHRAFCLLILNPFSIQRIPHQQTIAHMRRGPPSLPLNCRTDWNSSAAYTAHIMNEYVIVNTCAAHTRVVCKKRAPHNIDNTPWTESIQFSMVSSEARRK